MNKFVTISLLCCFLFIGCEHKISNAGPKPLFEHFPPQKNVTNEKWGTKLQDIKNHEVFYDNQFKDLVTTAHEATHDISIHFRMNEQKYYRNRINAFYVFNNQVAIVENPPIGLSKVYSFIPPSLKGQLFDSYFPSPDYEDNPLYIWEEWTAYVNGAEVGVDLVNQNLWRHGRRDTLVGVLEFLVYSAALAMAAEQMSPLYYNNYENFRKFFAWNVRRTWKVYNEARRMAPFANKMHEEYLSKIRNEKAAAHLYSLLQNYIEINN